MRRSIPLLLLVACAGPPAPRVPSCPPEDRDGWQDEDGCLDPDDDWDGNPDDTDRCPCLVEDRDQFEDEDGCPELDNDGDRRPDECDLCPNEPETLNGRDDLDGCPDQGIVVVHLDSIRISSRVLFPRGSVEVMADAAPLLDEIATVLQAFPGIRRVEVSGHATPDERRPDQLARRRADAVRDALIQRGVEPERLIAQGYGVQRPLVPNDTPEHRLLNRRADFTIVERDPTPPDPEPVPEVDRCPPAHDPVPVCARTSVAP